MELTKGWHIVGQFDVQVDSNHRWETDKVCEIDVYPMSLDADGNFVTDMQNTLAHVEVPAGNHCDDMWYGSHDDAVKTLPEHLRQPFKEAVALADAKQETMRRTTAPRAVGETVFITEHRFPGDIEAVTMNGCYIVNMANSGEVAEFRPDELEDYDAERWHA